MRNLDVWNHRPNVRLFATPSKLCCRSQKPGFSKLRKLREIGNMLPIFAELRTVSGPCENRLETIFQTKLYSSARCNRVGRLAKARGFKKPNRNAKVSPIDKVKNIDAKRKMLSVSERDVLNYGQVQIQNTPRPKTIAPNRAILSDRREKHLSQSIWVYAGGQDKGLLTVARDGQSIDCI